VEQRRHQPVGPLVRRHRDGHVPCPNTLLPYRENPPDRTIGEDDIAFADFGPVFEEYGADFGRTYVFGGDPHKHRLLGDLPRIFEVNDGAKAESYITPENDNPLRRTDKAGRDCHWILELHLVDRARGFGGFHAPGWCRWWHAGSRRPRAGSPSCRRSQRT